jgi:cyclophilin family peptidyl-prolyl cis-trans isomerase
LEVDGIVEGRVVLETRPDVAPKMAKNFASLCMGEKGFGYKGCQVFQCWGGESCIAGDFECNSGRGGRSIYAEEPFFMPDDSKLPCIRAAIGMRRTQKKHHSQGLVGSQFRILLRDMPFFTGVFGHVIHGLELVERVSFLGDHQGFPRKLITVANCGLLS